jgi:hypothetical protein
MASPFLFSIYLQSLSRQLSIISAIIETDDPLGHHAFAEHVTSLFKIWNSHVEKVTHFDIMIKHQAQGGARDGNCKTL